ncbi:unnamed protein product [Ectocarpus sp. 4 AP-2014]
MYEGREGTCAAQNFGSKALGHRTRTSSHLLQTGVLSRWRAAAGPSLRVGIDSSKVPPLNAESPDFLLLTVLLVRVLNDYLSAQRVGYLGASLGGRGGHC